MYAAIIYACVDCNTTCGLFSCGGFQANDVYYAVGEYRIYLRDFHVTQCPGSRSAASMMLDIPRTTTSLGDRAFAVAGPRVWNSLPPAIRDPSLSPSIFGKLLKTYLFV